MINLLVGGGSVNGEKKQSDSFGGFMGGGRPGGNMPGAMFGDVQETVDDTEDESTSTSSSRCSTLKPTTVSYICIFLSSSGTQIPSVPG